MTVSDNTIETGDTVDWWEIQERIAEQDPAGKPFPPTEAAEQAFRTWVLETYGQSIYDRYFRG